MREILLGHFFLAFLDFCLSMVLLARNFLVRKIASCGVVIGIVIAEHSRCICKDREIFVFRVGDAVTASCISRVS